MFYYRDNDNNLVASSRALSSPILTPITEEEYLAELEQK